MQPTEWCSAVRELLPPNASNAVQVAKSALAAPFIQININGSGS